MRLGKSTVRGLAALSVGASTLMFSMGIARADESYSENATFDHTFTNFAGEQVTCTVSFSSSLFRPTGRDAFFGSAFSGAFGSDESCSSGTFVAVDASYLDPSGRAKRVTADSIDGDVFLNVDDVARRYVVRHSAFFFDCVSNCEATFTTSPK